MTSFFVGEVRVCSTVACGGELRLPGRRRRGNGDATDRGFCFSALVLDMPVSAPAQTEDDGGSCRRFSSFILLGSVCNFLFSEMFLAVVVDREASLASSLDIPRMYAFLVLGVLPV